MQKAFEPKPAYIEVHHAAEEIRELIFTMSMCLSEEECRGMKRAQAFIADYLFDIDTVKTRDASEVVLCKDCTYCHSDRAGNIGCFHYKRYGTPAAEIQPDDFCSYGSLGE